MLLSVMPAAAFADGEELVADEQEEISELTVDNEDSEIIEEISEETELTETEEEAETDREYISGFMPRELVFESPNRAHTVSEPKKAGKDEASKSKIPIPTISREEAVETYRNVRLNHLDELKVAYSVPWSGTTQEEAEKAARQEYEQLRVDACAHIPGEPKLGDSLANNVDWFYRYISYEGTAAGELTVYIHLTEITYYSNYY